MFWIVLLVVVVGGFWLFSKAKNTPPSVRQSVREGKRNISQLGPAQKIEAEAALRETASHNYDTGFAGAKSAGKDENFCHQVAVLNSVSAVLLQRVASNKHEQDEMQGETVAFNLLAPEEGKAAVVEYLVWKFLPERADESKFAPALSAFRAKVFEDAKRENDDELPMVMIYMCRYDWQRYIADKLTPAPADQAGA